MCQHSTHRRPANFKKNKTKDFLFSLIEKKVLRGLTNQAYPYNLAEQIKSGI
jgi:hypothetical protein